MAAIDLGEQSLLALEVISDAGNVHLRGAGELAHRDAIESPFGEQLLRGLENPFARVVLSGRSGRSRACASSRGGPCSSPAGTAPSLWQVRQALRPVVASRL